MIKANEQKILERVLNINGFVALPDHEKLQLKKLGPPYSAYPLMSDFETHIRNEWINNVCCHFSNMDIETFMLYESYSTLSYWPNALDTFITPRLMDYINIETVLSFGFCYYCEHFVGKRISNYKNALNVKSIKNKVVPIYGKCKKAESLLKENKKSKFKNTDIVKLDFKCNEWNPTKFFKALICCNIKKELEFSNLQKKRKYSFQEYKQDLQMDFWDFFVMN